MRRVHPVIVLFVGLLGFLIGANIPRPYGGEGRGWVPKSPIDRSNPLSSRGEGISVGALTSRLSLSVTTATTVKTTDSGKTKTPLAPTATPETSLGAESESPASADECSGVIQGYKSYYSFSQKGATLRQQHGPLNIIAFSRLWPPPFHGTGGMQFHALHLYSQLAALGHRVHVLVTGPPDGEGKLHHYRVDPTSLKLVQEDSPNAPDVRLTVQQVHSASNGEYTEVWFENCLKEFLRLNATIPGGFQVAHSESWAGVPNIYQIGLPMAVTWHGSMLDWFRNEVNYIVHNFRMKGKMVNKEAVNRMSGLGSSVAYETYMLLTVPHHIVISDSAAKDLKDINLISPERIHLIYNGVNANNFRPDEDPDRKIRKKFLEDVSVSPDDFVVGCGGRLEAIKGHHQLSEAMNIIMQRHPHVTLLVAGQGGEGRRYEALKEKGLKVVLLGMMPQEKLARFYQSLDVFIDPFYQHHGLNTVMIEAVLSGIPIIATRLASAATTAPCKEFGLTFGLGEVSELVDRIELLMNDQDLRRRIAKNVRERAIHLFTSAIMAGSYEAQLYEAYLHPTPLHPITGKVVCKKTYPAMCYREPQMKDKEKEKN